MSISSKSHEQIRYLTNNETNQQTLPPSKLRRLIALGIPDMKHSSNEELLPAFNNARNYLYRQIHIPKSTSNSEDITSENYPIKPFIEKQRLIDMIAARYAEDHYRLTQQNLSLLSHL